MLFLFAVSAFIENIIAIDCLCGGRAQRTTTRWRYRWNISKIAEQPLPLRRWTRRLAALDSLQARIAEIRASVTGKIAFSTSLGLEDQAILAAIAGSGADIDIFTLDTGRHFPETLDTIDRSEQRFGLRIRVVAPDAAELEALVARDGVFGFRLSVDARKACCHVRKVLPLRRALGGAQGWITGLRRSQSQGRSAVPFAEWDRGAWPHQVQPAGRLVARTAQRLHHGQRRARQCAACAWLPLHRLPAMHAAQSSPARMCALAAGGGSRRTARSAACTTIPTVRARRRRRDGAPFPSRSARSGEHPHLPRGCRAVSPAGAALFDRQGLRPSCCTWRAKRSIRRSCRFPCCTSTRPGNSAT